jgi:hypothetical protein
MDEKCVDCGADAEIYDHGTPLCLLCTNVRDARATVSDQNVFEAVREARHGYRLAMDALRKSLDLMRDVDPGNPDGHLSLSQAKDRLSHAKTIYEQAVGRLVERSRHAARKNR